MLTTLQQQPKKRRLELGGKSVDDLRMMSDLLDDVQDQLEPIRDRALDEKARLTGFAQCAEAFIKIVAEKAIGLKKRAVEQAKEERVTAAEVPAKPKRRTKKAVKEEAKPSGNDSAEKQRGSS